MYERKTTLQINDFTPHFANPLLPAAILFRGRPCPVNGLLKLLSDEGGTRAWACTLFVLFVRLPCAGQKRKVCANAWLIGGLSVGKRDVRRLSPDSRILSRHCNFLCRYAKILSADWRFLKPIENFLGAYEKTLWRNPSFLKQEASFVRKDGNSLFLYAYFLKQVVSLLLFGSGKLQLAHLFILRTCRPENWFNVFLYL